MNTTPASQLNEGAEGEGGGGKASVEKVGLPRVSKLQLEGFFSRAAKCIATIRHACTIYELCEREPSRIAQGW